MEAEAQEIIDVGATVAVDIPAALEERMTDLRESAKQISTQAFRNGTWKTIRASTYAVGDMATDELCRKVVETMLSDAERNGEAPGYRARIMCQVAGTKHPKPYYAELKATVAEDGSIVAVDSDPGSTSLQVMTNVAKDAVMIQLDAMRQVHNVIAGYGKIAEAFQIMMTESAKAYTDQRNHMTEIYRLQLELESNRQTHLERLDRNKKFMEMFKGPIEQATDLTKAYIMNEWAKKNANAKTEPKPKQNPPRKAKTKTESKSPMSTHASSLRDVLTSLDDKSKESLEKIMSKDEHELLQEASRATTDEDFSMSFRQLKELVMSRGESGMTAWIDQISQSVGEVHMMRLFALFHAADQTS